MRRISKRTWIILAAAAAAILLIIAFTSCSAPGNSSRNAAFQDQPASAAGCYAPLACGPAYAGYVPSYYLAHPSYTYLSPYSSFYAPSFNGRSYTVSRTPAGVAPVSMRPALPYPPGYRPVPGSFQPSASRPSSRSSAPVFRSPSRTTRRR